MTTGARLSSAVPRHRYRPTDWIYFSRGGDAGIREPEGLWRVRQRQQAGWLERVVDVCAVAGAAVIYIDTTANYYQNAS